MLPVHNFFDKRHKTRSRSLTNMHATRSVKVPVRSTSMNTGSCHTLNLRHRLRFPTPFLLAHLDRSLCLSLCMITAYWLTSLSTDLFPDPPTAPPRILHGAVPVLLAPTQMSESSKDMLLLRMELEEAIVESMSLYFRFDALPWQWQQEVRIFVYVCACCAT